jgi:hypothetical protein
MAIMVTTALAFTTAATACGQAHGQGHGDGAVRRRVTACDTLGRDDVAAALGSPVGPPDAADDQGADALAGRSGCAWSTGDDERAVLVELVRTGDMSTSVRRTGFSARARFAAARSRHPDAVDVDLGGAGGDAVWVEEAATLHVLVRDCYLTFEVAVPDPAAAEATAVELAVRAVRRLGERARAD